MAFLTDHSELIAGYVMGLVSYLLKDLYRLFRRSNLPNKHDILAYSEYKNLFNSDLLMLLQNQNFRNAFRPSTLDGFFEFCNKGLDKHPDYKFHNRRLEKHRADLTAAMVGFLHLSLAHLYDNKDNSQSETKTDIQDRPKSLNLKSTSLKKLKLSARKTYDAYHKLNDACGRHFDVKIEYINR